MAIASFEAEVYDASHLDTFGDSCGAKVRVDVQIGNNTKPMGAAYGVEAELDIEYIKGVAPSVPLTVIYNKDYSISTVE